QGGGSRAASAGRQRRGAQGARGGRARSGGGDGVARVGVAYGGLDAPDQPVDFLPVAVDHHRDPGQRQGESGGVTAAQSQDQRGEAPGDASGEREHGRPPGDGEGAGACDQGETGDRRGDHAGGAEKGGGDLPAPERGGDQP